MSAKTVLAEAVARGLTLTAAGEKIIYTGPREAVTDDLLDRLRQHKPELLQLLAKAESGEALFTNFGKGYQHPDGRIDSGKPAPAPPAAVAWPDDLDAMLRRVSCAFEWTDTDRRAFVAWSQHSPDSLAEARQFLQSECAKLPVPGLDARRRVVLDMLQADPSIRYAYTVTDDGIADPVVLTLAIRDAGTCELGIPRAKFDALGLPLLIERLSQTREGAA